MKLLRDRVRPVPFSQVRSGVEESLGREIGEVFSSVDERPLGTASVGAVYSGRLISGEAVVLKVRRPGIAKDIETDLSLLKLLAQQAERVSEEARGLGVSRIVDGFARSLANELNFKHRGPSTPRGSARSWRSTTRRGSSTSPRCSGSCPARPCW